MLLYGIVATVISPSAKMTSKEASQPGVDDSSAFQLLGAGRSMRTMTIVIAVAGACTHEKRWREIESRMGNLVGPSTQSAINPLMVELTHMSASEKRYRGAVASVGPFW